MNDFDDPPLGGRAEDDQVRAFFAAEPIDLLGPRPGTLGTVLGAGRRRVVGRRLAWAAPLAAAAVVAGVLTGPALLGSPTTSTTPAPPVAGGTSPTPVPRPSPARAEDFATLPAPELDCRAVRDSATQVLGVAQHRFGTRTLAFVVRACLASTTSFPEVVQVFDLGTREPVQVDTLLTETDSARGLTVTFAGDTVVLDGRARLADDPGCCPSGTLHREYTLVPGAGSAVSFRPSEATTPPAVIAEPDGLGYLAGPASIRHLTFGTATREQVTTLLTSALGPVTESAQPDCGPGIAFVGVKGTGAFFRNDTFIGWSDQGGGPAPWLTPIGLGRPSSIADWRQDFPGLVVTDSTLGLEFTTGGDPAFSGISTDGTESGPLSFLAAGQTCTYR